MCFVLYIATPCPLPIVPWDENARGIHTEELSDGAKGVAAQFSYPHVYFIGSDTYCGCGFRYTRFQNGYWPEEEWIYEGDTSHIEAQPNHERLVDFIYNHFGSSGAFELYGAWESAYHAPPLSVQQIGIKRLLDLDFFFRDRGLYTVSMS